MWQRIKTFFKNSETIALARFQVLLGIVLGLLTYVDPHMVASLFPQASWVPWFLLGHGIAMEYLRRRRAEDLK